MSKTRSTSSVLPPSRYGAAIDAAFEDLDGVEVTEADARTRLSNAEAEKTQLIGLIRSLIGRLPKDEQGPYLRRLDSRAIARSTSIARAGETLNNVVQLFTEQPKPVWTAAEVQTAFTARFGPSEAKAIYNALNQLERTGRLRRVTRGRYLDTEHGIGIELDDDRPFDGPQKGGVMED